jgi:hypothetical protein
MVFIFDTSRNLGWFELNQASKNPKIKSKLIQHIFQIKKNKIKYYSVTDRKNKPKVIDLIKRCTYNYDCTFLYDSKIIFY